MDQHLNEPKKGAVSANISPSTAASSPGAATFQPVFIVGCVRSGSTMLGAMVGAHPEVVCIPEAQFIVDLMPRGDDPNGDIDPVEVIDSVVKHWRFLVWEFDLGQRRPPCGAIRLTYRGTIEWLVRQYARSVDRSGARIWVDQAPGHAMHIWKLLRHFADAK